MGSWFDACEGWAKTVARSQAFSFSAPFVDSGSDTAIGILSSDTTFDPTNLSGKKIGKKYCAYNINVTIRDISVFEQR